MKWLSVALLIAALPSAFSVADNDADIAAYRALTEQDKRLATIGYRLELANAPFCDEKAPNPGWVIHDIAQYPDAAIAKAAFGLKTPIEISAVVVGGPADQAGLQVGDGFAALDGIAIDWAKMVAGKTGYERMAKFKMLLAERIGSDGALRLSTRRQTQIKNFVIKSPLICASDFQIDTRDGLDAGADGAMVRVTYDLARYASDDGELAAIVAHELSHNILRHRERLNAQGVDRGLGRMFGKSRKAILQTEIEADQLSVWLMANAGYKPEAAVTFWQGYGPKSGGGIFGDGTHLSWKKRVALLKNEIETLKAAVRHNGKLQPPLLTHPETKSE
jgi:beta-barrel assembly-enhancing protease